jgi:hypothetical protein
MCSITDKTVYSAEYPVAICGGEVAVFPFSLKRSSGIVAFSSFMLSCKRLKIVRVLQK